MKEIVAGVKVLEGHTPRDVPVAELLGGNEPVVLKGLLRSWDIVAAGAESDQAAMQYLRSFYSGRPLSTAFVPAEAQGRLHYTNDFTQLNFDNKNMLLGDVLHAIEDGFDQADRPGIYIASALVDKFLPGFSRENYLDLAAHGIDAPPSIWIGNRITASCHYDAPHNLACSVVGLRRFTLFPPEQIFNLYPGPLDPTPGGQVVSLVDFDAPDLQRYPRFTQALEAARVVELAPGDALYIPSLWWHHVQGLARFNVLVNYWWSTVPNYIPSPINALYHTIWSLRSRPDSEKRAWQAIFDYYVFGDASEARGHLPVEARGALGEIDEYCARQFRARLINALNR